MRHCCQSLGDTPFPMYRCSRPQDVQHKMVCYHQRVWPTLNTHNIDNCWYVYYNIWNYNVLTVLCYQPGTHVCTMNYNHPWLWLERKKRAMFDRVLHGALTVETQQCGAAAWSDAECSYLAFAMLFICLSVTSRNSLFLSFRLNSDITVRISDPDFLTESDNLAIRRRFQALFSL